MFSYCENNPVNNSDPNGTLPAWAKKILIGTAVIAAAAVLTVATAGTGTALACFAVGALKGAAIGAAVGAATGAAAGAVGHRMSTGSWKGSGQAALDGAATGYMSGAITGAITGGLTSKTCFIAGTAVLTATGAVAIEKIKAGDYVWAWNEDTGDVELKEVAETYINESTELVHIGINDAEIICTNEHPFYSPVKGWTAACKLRAGDILQTVNGEYVVVEWVQHELLENPVKVYNFQVEDDHTYYVSNGILVHNTCKPDYQKLSTGRSTPNNLTEQIAMESVKSNPAAGNVIIKTLNDPRIPSGFSKFSQVFNTSQGTIDIHYVGNVTLNIFFDFKFTT